MSDFGPIDPKREHTTSGYARPPIIVSSDGACYPRG